MPAYQVKVMLETGGVMLFGFTAKNPRKLTLRQLWLTNLLIELPVTSVEMQQLPGKRKRGVSSRPIS